MWYGQCYFSIHLLASHKLKAFSCFKKLWHFPIESSTHHVLDQKRFVKRVTRTMQHVWTNHMGKTKWSGFSYIFNIIIKLNLDIISFHLMLQIISIMKRELPLRILNFKTRSFFKTSTKDILQSAEWCWITLLTPFYI